MRKLFWIFIIILVAGSIMYGVWPDFREGVNFVAIKVIGEPTYQGIASFAVGVAANPIYQTYHPLLWLFGGIILCVAFIKLWPKRPQLLKPSVQPLPTSPPMQGPKTILVQEVPVSTKTTKTVEPQPEVKIVKEPEVPAE